MVNRSSLVWQKFIDLRFSDCQFSHEPFQDGGRYHIETSPLICGANQWTGFYLITASVLKGLRGGIVLSYTHIYGKKFIEIVFFRC